MTCSTNGDAGGPLDRQARNFNARPDDAEIARRCEADARERLQKLSSRRHLARPATGDTAVGRYLLSRGITLPSPPTLRHHPMHECYGRHPTGSYRPQMIALIEHVEYRPMAVSRTFLTVDGSGKAFFMRDHRELACDRDDGALVAALRRHPYASVDHLR